MENASHTYKKPAKNSKKLHKQPNDRKMTIEGEYAELPTQLRHLRRFTDVNEDEFPTKAKRRVVLT